MVYKVKISGFWSIFNISGRYYWDSGKIDFEWQNFKNIDEVKKIINSFKIKKEIIKNI